MRNDLLFSLVMEMPRTWRSEGHPPEYMYRASLDLDLGQTLGTDCLPPITLTLPMLLVLMDVQRTRTLSALFHSRSLMIVPNLITLSNLHNSPITRRLQQTTVLKLLAFPQFSHLTHIVCILSAGEFLTVLILDDCTSPCSTAIIYFLPGPPLLESFVGRLVPIEFEAHTTVKQALGGGGVIHTARTSDDTLC
jgi:hypothetical protein